MPMSEKFNLEFRTFGESELIKMKEESQNWLFAQWEKSEPYWCSLLGTSGTGKTYLAKQCKDKIEKLGLNVFRCKFSGVNQYKDVSFFYWPTIARKLRGQEYDIVPYIIETDFRFIDDLGAENKSDYVIGALNEICNSRIGKCTFITSNLSMLDIHDNFDARIASRMKRGKNIIIQTNATDYDLR